LYHPIIQVFVGHKNQFCTALRKLATSETMSNVTRVKLTHIL